VYELHRLTEEEVRIVEEDDLKNNYVRKIRNVQL